MGKFLSRYIHCCLICMESDRIRWNLKLCCMGIRGGCSPISPIFAAEYKNVKIISHAIYLLIYRGWDYHLILSIFTVYLVMVLYMFSINSILWASQWLDYAHLRIRPFFFAKKYVYQVLLRYLHFYSSYRRQTSGFEIVSSSWFIYTYIALYLSRLVLGDTNNRSVNKTITLYCNMLQEYNKKW